MLILLAPKLCQSLSFNLSTNLFSPGKDPVNVPKYGYKYILVISV